LIFEKKEKKSKRSTEDGDYEIDRELPDADESFLRRKANDTNLAPNKYSEYRRISKK